MASKMIKNYLPELFAIGVKRINPQMVTVNVTDKCNQKCIYCEIGMGISSPVNERLSVDDLKWIIEEMKKEGIPKISICGGEPFLFGGLLEVIGFAHSCGIRTSITSNGMNIGRLSSQDLDVLKMSRTEVNISIDSFSPEINSFIRGESIALMNARESIEVLLEHKIPVTVLTAISRFNYHELYDTMLGAYEMGVRQILFQPVICFSNYPDRPPINDKRLINVEVDRIDNLIEQLRLILAFERNHPIKTNVYRILPWIVSYLRKAAGENGKYFFDEVLKKFYCREVYAIVDITYSGEIQPCGLKRGSVSIKENRNAGLLNLWKEATKEIRTHLESGRLYPECNGCCHHFSRNMIASMLKFPVKNRETWSEMTPLLIARLASRIKKNMRSENLDHDGIRN